MGGERLRAAVRRLGRRLRGRWRGSASAAPKPIEPEPATADQPLEPWQQGIEQRLGLLEARHDTTIRRQTILILLTIAGEVALELIKRNR